MTNAPSPKAAARAYRGPFYEAARWVVRGFMRLLGWRVQGDWPADTPKAVVLYAPHTSNWDAVWALCAVYYYRIRPRWIGKASLMKGPLRPLGKWLGGIPVDRSSRQNLVDQLRAAFNAEEELIIGIAPEGSRELRTEWKTGYHAIAVGAGVPIIVATADYKEKWCGVIGIVHPTGDLDTDRATINKMLEGSHAKHPDQFSLDQTGADT